MRLPTLFSVVLLGCNAVMMANDNLQLMITTRPEILKGVLAGIHAFSQIELLNIVSMPWLNEDFGSISSKLSPVLRWSKTKHDEVITFLMLS